MLIHFRAASTYAVLTATSGSAHLELGLRAVDVSTGTHSDWDIFPDGSEGDAMLIDVRWYAGFLREGICAGDG